MPRGERAHLRAQASGKCPLPISPLEITFALGESVNANPFELAAALLRYGFRVSEIYGAPAPEYYVYVNRIAELSPDTRIYSNLHPSMLHYDAAQAEGKTGSESGNGPGAVTVSIGRDAGWYHPDLPNVQWNSDVQPFGYRAVSGLFRALTEAMETGGRGSHASMIMLKGRDEQVSSNEDTYEHLSHADALQASLMGSQ